MTQVMQVLSCRGCSFLSLLSNNITKFPDDFGVHFPNLKCITTPTALQYNRKSALMHKVRYLDISFNPIILLPTSLVLCPLETIKGGSFPVCAAARD